jgi:tetratricopeptide (TPR) repeat protein
MIVLKCPSCNGDLELPDNLEVAHCLYCGTKILLKESNSSTNIKQYIELSKAALSAKNYREAIEYCNKVLEIDSNNIDAWIDKGVSISNITAGSRHQYDEAMSYLKKAESIAPDYNRISEAKGIITQNQVLMYVYQGDIEFKEAQEINNSRSRRGIPGLNVSSILINAAGRVKDASDAKSEGSKRFIRAMEYYLAASTYMPSNPVVLQRIYTLAQTANWIKWNSNVYNLINNYARMVSNTKRK